MNNIIKTTMKKITFSVLLFIIFVHGLIAQDAGTESNFSLGFGARALGLGQAYTALAEDPSAVFWNPAGLEFINQQSATFFHTTLFDATQYDFLGYAYPTLDLGSFGFAIGRLGFSGVDEYDREGVRQGEISLEEYQVFFSYAKKLPWYNITPGITIRWIRQDLDHTSQRHCVNRPIHYHSLPAGQHDLHLATSRRWRGGGLCR